MMICTRCATLQEYVNYTCCKPTCTGKLTVIHLPFEYKLVSETETRKTYICVYDYSSLQMSDKPHAQVLTVMKARL